MISAWAIGMLIVGAAWFACGPYGGYWFLLEHSGHGTAGFYAFMVAMMMLVAGPLFGSYLMWHGAKLYRKERC